MVQNLESPGLSGRVDSTRDRRIVSPSSKGIYVYVDTLVQIEPEYYGPITLVQSGRLKFYPFLVHLNLGGNVRHPGTLNTREIRVQNKVIRNFMELLDFFFWGGGAQLLEPQMQIALFGEDQRPDPETAEIEPTDLATEISKRTGTSVDNGALNKELQQRRRRRQRGRQKSNRFITQNNNFARASRFFVHFFTVLARIRRENA